MKETPSISDVQAVMSEFVNHGFHSVS